MFLSKRKLWQARLSALDGIRGDLVGAEVVVVGGGLWLQTLIVQILEKKIAKF